MPIIEIETDRRVAMPREHNEMSELGPTSTARLERLQRSARYAHFVDAGLPRLPHRLGVVLVAAIASIPVGCEVSELPPPPLDSSSGSSSSTGTGDSDGPAGSTSTGNPGADSTGDTGAGTTGDTGVGITGDTGASTTGDTGASTTGGTGASTAGDTEASSTGDTEASTTGASACEGNDAWEPNDAPEAPSLVPWGGDSDVSLDAFLCSGESDWYRYDVDSLGYDYHRLHLDGIVAGSSWCGASCDDPFLPDAPENTMGVEVYDADTLVLLNSQIAPDGRIDIGGAGEPYSHDLLIRVYGPNPAATYDYALYVEIRDYNGEDECEC